MAIAHAPPPTHPPELPQRPSDAARVDRAAAIFRGRERPGENQPARGRGLPHAAPLLPHRDDFEFTLAEHPAKDFASEGQQRALVIALRLAQAAWFQTRRGVRPVLLADDVLGEIDPARRERFWAAIDPEAQVLATGTPLPAGTKASAWEVFYVTGGAFAPADPGV